MKTQLTLTVEQLIAADSALVRLQETALPAPVAFKIGRIIREARRERVTAEETRQALALKYGQAEDDGSVTIPQERIAEFVEELRPFLQTEVTLAAAPICLADLGDAPVTPGEIDALAWMLTD